jgi:hypothetical protein
MGNTVQFDDVAGYVSAGMPASYSYAEYRGLIRDLLEKGLSTGPVQNDELLEYSRLSEHRMNKWDKHFRLSDEMKAELNRPHPVKTWLVITEGWCGDSAQIIPVLNVLAEAGGIALRMVLRDEHDWLMDLYRTNGSRSIPVLIALDGQGREVFRWGPRPRKIQELLYTMKASTDPVHSAEAIKEAIHLYFGRDRGAEIQRDIQSLLQEAALRSSAEPVSNVGTEVGKKGVHSVNEAIVLCITNPPFFP